MPGPGGKRKCDTPSALQQSCVPGMTFYDDSQTIAVDMDEADQDSATKLYVIDSDPVVALKKTRSLLQSDKLQGYSAEADLTYTTWPR